MGEHTPTPWIAAAMTGWKSIDERPEWDHQPMRQFIHIEGYNEHSGCKWHRAICGTAFIRKPGADDEMLQYRRVDILQLCKDGDIDLHSARVIHWMPAIFQAFEAPVNEIARLRAVVTALANASQSEATSRLRRLAKEALSLPQADRGGAT